MILRNTEPIDVEVDVVSSWLHISKHDGRRAFTLSTEHALAEFLDERIPIDVFGLRAFGEELRTLLT